MKDFVGFHEVRSYIHAVRFVSDFRLCTPHHTTQRNM
jgi:hypothetical protein